MTLATAKGNAVATRIQPKDNLESYAYNLRNSIKELETAIKETEEYDNRQKELQAVAVAIMRKLSVAVD
ncbi:hypothetical protein EDD16DRAFT_1707542 [Pisolithus croceorrhizus]|nr:hypothetical protein EDD16DRAFT_1707542 [Pisolithus croceorrhizus]KAI6131836.1 hypothetical protein EV401DRAFT_2065425 [Pisolithus croceorrhizus]